MPKTTLLKQILELLQADLDLQTQAARLAYEEAISEESRAESKYDTHGQEAAYLAEGQAKLVAEIRESIAIYQAMQMPFFQSTDPIALGAVVEISSADQQTRYFLGPRSGGLELTDTQNNPVLLITPLSPLGRQLIGRRLGESVTMPGRDTSLRTITGIV